MCGVNAISVLSSSIGLHAFFFASQYSRSVASSFDAPSQVVFATGTCRPSNYGCFFLCLTAVPRLSSVNLFSFQTINLLRAFSSGGFADINSLNAWNMDFVQNTAEGSKYRQMADRIEETLRFMTVRNCGDLFYEKNDVCFGFSVAIFVRKMIYWCSIARYIGCFGYFLFLFLLLANR